jgi:hypothetical protein
VGKSFTDHKGKDVETANVVKVFTAPKKNPELKGAECMVMSKNINGIVMLSVEKAPKNVETRRIVYVEATCLEFLRNRP